MLKIILKSFVFWSSALAFFFFSSCSEPNQKEADMESQLEKPGNFTLLNGQTTGVSFRNQIIENESLNYYSYAYIYNGGGAATADLNNDGLIDVCLVSNLEGVKIFQNKGSFNFEEKEAPPYPVQKGFNQGVSTVDINNDGLIDLYISRSGQFQNDNDRKNLLFINKGNFQFEEQASAYGLDESGFSVQAYFFDYDNDGDLDMYQVNHRVDWSNAKFFAERNNYQPHFPDTDKLYENMGNGKFNNVTRKAGLMNFAWGLSAVPADFNDDGLTDIFVSNDFFEPDYLYINQGDGTFKNEIKKHFNHTSMYSMGSDRADLDNDGLEELMVLDMAPATHERSKRLMLPMRVDDFNTMVDKGLAHQYMRNSLQKNMGNGIYSEQAQISGISQTDWSWSTLMADIDNDGFNDVLVTNGIRRDVTDQDSRKNLKDYVKSNGGKAKLEDLNKLIPESKLSNKYFKNKGDGTFIDASTDWNLDDILNSNGMALADFDNDGDLDFVINNMDQEASIYRNNTNSDNYITVKLEGPEKNIHGYGATLKLFCKDQLIYRRQQPSRGYLSSMEERLFFGLGELIPDSLEVNWGNGRSTKIYDLKKGSQISVNYKNAKAIVKEAKLKSLLTEAKGSSGINFIHKENRFNDFKEEILLPHKQSENGPFISKGDINGDGLEDFFIGGAKDQAGNIYLQNASGTFRMGNNGAFKKDKACEDLGSLFFDADQDGDQDLYIVSGGNEFSLSDKSLNDRLYFNDGKGNYTKKTSALPGLAQSGQEVKAADIDQDGDLDLIVPGRIVPGGYPQAPKSYLLKNEGGRFVDATEEFAPQLKNIGMITDLEFLDFDSDGDMDLMICGEWMGIEIFENNKGVLTKKKQEHSSKIGWWFSLNLIDIDNDGDLDVIAGNIGENNKFRPSINKPLNVYCKDFDENGTNDIVLSKKEGNVEYPVRGRECSSDQMPFIKEKFPDFESFAKSSLQDIYSSDKLKNAIHLEATFFKSIVLINDNGSFEAVDLPLQAQVSPIMDAVALDINGDGINEILLSGNHFGAEVETVRYDSGTGLCLEGQSAKELKEIPLSKTGFLTRGNAKSMEIVNTKNGPLVLVANNNARIQVFQKN